MMDPSQPTYYPVEPNFQTPNAYPPQLPIAQQPVVHGSMPGPGYPSQFVEQPVQYYPVQAEPPQSFSPPMVYEEEQHQFAAQEPEYFIP
jgi:hypothetical protein